MFLRKVRLVHWPLAILAQACGYVVLFLVSIGKVDFAMRVAKIPNFLWKGIQ